MELRDLAPPDFGVVAPGIYIIDDDGLCLLAGPFDAETAAIAWIVERQESFGRTPATSAVRYALTVQAALV